jgi:hypothetical protein
MGDLDESASFFTGARERPIPTIWHSHWLRV